MLTQREFARLVDGPALDREIDRLTKKGGGWLQAAQILSRRVNGTLDWEVLGPAGARYQVVGSRGEAVLFWDDHLKNRIMKLRGREENGYGTAGFGCILVRNERGMIDYGPGTIEQALERERLSWEHLGFGCVFEDVIGDVEGLLLAQAFISGSAPTEHEIHAWMTQHGWESLAEARDVAVTLRQHAWRRGRVGAFDANETNFIKSDADGLLYPIDLIVWTMPE
ncbi:hypothetical protein [Prosthecobacter sp.]|uniref:hypothetical protein n=1 Tax=Prosthecobacter sp. TaxID=1965333 RepID=UPI00248840C4|nr:hypothetical protein [Prosthecobacter sp.]MDI1315648.1 hypothetical protein [Prosthecobacter sp.]